MTVLNFHGLNHSIYFELPNVSKLSMDKHGTMSLIVQIKCESVSVNWMTMSHFLHHYSVDHRK